MCAVAAVRRPCAGLISAMAVILIGSAVGIAQEGPEPMTPEIESVLGRVTADSLRGHLSFLASDLLEGRGTPSRGLDLAAEYIAAQFRRAGLEPIGDDGYFQTAHWRSDVPDADSFAAEFHQGGEDLRIPLGRTSLRFADRAIDVRRAALFKLGVPSGEEAKVPAADEVKDKAVFIAEPDPGDVKPADRAKVLTASVRLQSRLAEQGAALLVTVDRRATNGLGLGPGGLIDPENRGASPRGRGSNSTSRPPSIIIHDPEVIKRLDALPTGPTSASLSLHVAAPVERPVNVRNVVGLLRGSDPKLRETYVLVTAHYDHLGMRPTGGGDRIFNGANDDGSGTVSVIELAAALATAKPRPKRSLVFMTFFGEERGLLGSRYYTQHPVLPLDRTVADVNLEQVGRTDSNEGPQLDAASMTGFDFSSLAPTFEAAGRRLGIRVFKHPRYSDAFFGASDNHAFAQQGIPAHTICVAYQYPDYHQVGDHWDKVDFANMARVDRTIALGLLTIANDPNPPRWNESNPKAARYAHAAKTP